MLFNHDAQVEVRAHRLGGLCDRRDVRAGDLLLLPAQGRDVEFAKRSFRIAAAFGFASACSVIVLGDESGYTVSEAQQTKLAAMEAMWETEARARRPERCRGHQRKGDEERLGDEDPLGAGSDRYALVDRQLPGIKDLRAKNRERIVSGIEAVKALEALRSNPATRRRKRLSTHTRPTSASACC